jgi:hypothetical protein
VLDRREWKISWPMNWPIQGDPARKARTLVIATASRR